MKFNVGWLDRNELSPKQQQQTKQMNLCLKFNASKASTVSSGFHSLPIESLLAVTIEALS